MLSTTNSRTDLLQLNRKSASYPMSNNFLTTFTKWAKIWMSASTNSSIPCKRKIAPNQQARDTDIRARINYYDQSQLQPQQRDVPSSQRTHLYRATCLKLRPNASPTRKLFRLGDILHVRKFWDKLESLVYQDLSNTPQYLPPSQRLPFNPDKPGSIFLPRKSKRNLAAFRHLSSPKRKSFASTTIVYNNSSRNNIIKVLPVVVPQDDDDDVPLGALDFSNSKASPYRR
ncbi:unnamed protein product [Mucor hiemalis]